MMSSDKREYPEDWTKDDIKRYEDIVSSILAGFEQVRGGLGISWHELPWKRMRELAERLAQLGFDFTVQDSYLIGTYLLSSAREQIQQSERAVAQAHREAEDGSDNTTS
jgi:hypothetical protein